MSSLTAGQPCSIVTREEINATSPPIPASALNSLLDTMLSNENADQETIELYYHAAVSDKLPGYVLLEVIDTSLWPYAAQLKVQRVGGIG